MRLSRAALRPVLLLALLLVGVTAAQEGYYPSAAGTSWTYNSGETQSLSGPREVAGQQVMVLTHYFDGVPVSEDYLLFGEDVRSLGTASGGSVISYSPPLVVYGRAPLAVGQRWESATSVSGVQVQLQAEVLSVQGVATPVGRFNAMQIRQTTTTDSGARSVLDIFYVPGVGAVRYVTNDGTVIDLIDRSVP